MDTTNYTYRGYSITEYPTSDNEPRMWGVVDSNGNELAGAYESPAKCEETIDSRINEGVWQER